MGYEYSDVWFVISPCLKHFMIINSTFSYRILDKIQGNLNDSCYFLLYYFYSYEVGTR